MVTLLGARRQGEMDTRRRPASSTRRSQPRATPDRRLVRPQPDPPPGRQSSDDRHLERPARAGRARPAVLDGHGAADPQVDAGEDSELGQLQVPGRVAAGGRLLVGQPGNPRRREPGQPGPQIGHRVRRREPQHHVAPRSRRAVGQADGDLADAGFGIGALSHATRQDERVRLDRGGAT